MMLAFVLEAFAHACAVLATLRAASRINYLARHGGKIGLMNGPMIAGPTLREDGDNVLKERQSPLWDISFILEKTIQFACASSLAGNVRKAVLQHDACFFPSAKDVLTEKAEPMQELNHRDKSTSPIMFLSSFCNMGIQSSVTWENPSLRYRRSQVPSEADFAVVDSVSVAIPCIFRSNCANFFRKKVAEVNVYAPTVFSQLRSSFGINDERFIQSLQAPFLSFQSNSKGAARSGLFFFFTRDGAYMIKSVKKSEARTLLKTLPKYFQYMTHGQSARKSLLSRICGLYEINMLEYEQEINSKFNNMNTNHLEDLPSHRLHKKGRFYLVVMNSVYPATSSQFFSERFDLKGSTSGRICSRDELKDKGSNAVQKDLNLVYEELSSPHVDATYKRGLNLSARSKAALLAQLSEDTRLLIECGVMDYSLLVGVAKVNMSHSTISEKSVVSFHSRHVPRTNRFGARNENTIPDWSKVFCITTKLLPALVHTAFVIPLFFVKKIHYTLDVILSTIGFSSTIPYYGAELCGVDAGTLSVIRGQRKGERVLYFLGLIDFLQPWTTKKAVEREVKGLLGYNKTSISAAEPQDYGTRLMKFLEVQVTA